MTMGETVENSTRKPQSAANIVSIWIKKNGE
jgi:hypothetical protein